MMRLFPSDTHEDDKLSEAALMMRLCKDSLCMPEIRRISEHSCLIPQKSLISDSAQDASLDTHEDEIQSETTLKIIGVIIMGKIEQTIIFKASPEDVYDALMDSKKHSKFSGSKSEISRSVGGKFTAYDDYISGTTVELVAGKKIVQRWRGSDWPEGHFSIATFEFKKIKDGTELTFTQEGVPDNQVKSITQGWIDFYWEPMKKTFGW